MIVPKYFEDLTILHENTMPDRAYYIPSSRKQYDLVECREHSDRFTLLNGDWQFCYYNSIYDLNDSGKLGHCSAALPDENGILRYGIVDSRGRIILPFRFDGITIFSEWNPATSEYEERGIADLDGASHPFTLRKR